jgi:two-component system NarL family response regulator
MSAGGAAKIRVMVVDDHRLVRQGVTSLLRTYGHIEVVAEGADGAEAIALYRQHRPDVTLMDLRMPVCNGVEAIARVRQEFPDAKFIVLSTYDVDHEIARALDAGARGYLLKDMSAAELTAAIEAVHAGRRRLAPEIAERALAPAESDLTDREMEVLRLMAQGQSNKEIGAALAITEATVKAHVTAVLRKLGVSQRAQAIVAAAQRGLVKL